MGIESAIGFAILGYTLAGVAVAGTSLAVSEAGKAGKKAGALDIARGEEAKRRGAELKRLTGLGATPEQKARVRRKTKTLLAGSLTGQEEFGLPPPTLLGGGDPTKARVVG